MKKNLPSDSRTPLRRIMTAIAAAMTGVLFFTVLSNRIEDTEDLTKGLDYIKSLENTDTAPLEKELKKLQQEERAEAIKKGELDIWQQFRDSALLGDSRTADFSYHGFIEENRVLAETGSTILDIPKYLDTLKTLNPSDVFLCFGINDIGIERWTSVEDYIPELDAMIAKLHEALPEASIYVNSIIPVRDVTEASSKWNAVPAWNEALQKYCAQKEIPYINLTETVAQHRDLYDADGIHMKKDFYTYWALDMITEINQHE